MRRGGREAHKASAGMCTDFNKLPKEFRFSGGALSELGQPMTLITGDLHVKG
jgi:hypothetical protein